MVAAWTEISQTGIVKEGYEKHQKSTKSIAFLVLRTRIDITAII